MSVGKKWGNTFNSFYKHLKNILFERTFHISAGVCVQDPPSTVSSWLQVGKTPEKWKSGKNEKNYIFFKLVPIIANLFTYCEILFLIKK